MRVIVALDVPWPDDALRLVEVIGADWYKIGLELIYTRGGLDFARRLLDQGLHLFLDAKLSDIPTTVARATATICRDVAPHYLSVRTAIPEAIAACHGRTVIAAVPTLTSDLTAAAQKSPASAVVCSPGIAANVRALNPRATIICPGARLVGDDAGDHVGTTIIPGCADFVVVGRPITRSADPRGAYDRYCSQDN